MRALVVYESMYGNTQAIAAAIAAGLTESGFEVSTSEVGEAPTDLGQLDLVVAGGPTHAFSMSRVSTREDAATKGDNPVISQGIGLREWIEALEPLASADEVAVATFDTRVRHPRVPGSAARAARKHLRQHGFRAVDPATTFWVDGMEGPLLDGEEDRARSWGRDLGAIVRTHRSVPG